MIDAMRRPRIVGRDQAFEALRRYLTFTGSRPAELMDLADALRASRPVRHALEVLLRRRRFTPSGPTVHCNGALRKNDEEPKSS